MEGSRVLTCVYCGHAYPQGAPTWGHEVLTDHIRVCPKHPLRQAEADIQLLRDALVGLIGASEKCELENMEIFIRSQVAPEADKSAAINGIRALLCTIPRAERNELNSDKEV